MEEGEDDRMPGLESNSNLEDEEEPKPPLNNKHQCTIQFTLGGTTLGRPLPIPPAFDKDVLPSMKKKKGIV